MTKKILLVDDEFTSTLFLSAYLKDNNYDVQTSMSGEEAITLGKLFRPDILITDWMLKDRKDGTDVAQELIAELPELRVIFVTGMAAEALQDKLTGIMNYTIMEKPIRMDHILQFIEQHS